MAPASVQSPGLHLVPDCQSVRLRSGSGWGPEVSTQGVPGGSPRYVSGAGTQLVASRRGRRRASGRAGAAYGRQMALEKLAERRKLAKEKLRAPFGCPPFLDNFREGDIRQLQAGSRPAVPQLRPAPQAAPPGPAQPLGLSPAPLRLPPGLPSRLHPACHPWPRLRPDACPLASPGYLLRASGLPGGAACKSPSREGGRRGGCGAARLFLIEAL